MPYKRLKDLPEAIRVNLPEHAQEIFRAAYNNAWEEYKDPEKRHPDSDHEETARKVAWAAVKTQYEKDETTGEWKKKEATG